MRHLGRRDQKINGECRILRKLREKMGCTGKYLPGCMLFSFDIDFPDSLLYFKKTTSSGHAKAFQRWCDSKTNGFVSAAIHAVFGEHAKELTVVSTKSMTGHLLGGAGGVEAVFTALALRDQFAPPTIHYAQPDPECDLDYVPNVGRAQNMTYALSNSLGFGGHNACIALRRWEE